MKDEKNRTDSARKKYLSADYSINEAEQAAIDRDLQSPEYISFTDEKQNPLLLPDAYSAAATYQIIEKRIGTNISRRLPAWSRWAAAASVAILIACGLYFVLPSQPGMLMASTSYGETRELILPDGSKVTLNALSTLKYPEKFKGTDRNVELEGEAFFEVQKDSEHPFKVKASEVQVEVLGTQFDVQAYPDEATIETVLKEGSVAVTSDGDRQVLVPGERAVFNKKTQALSIDQAEVKDQIQWVNGFLIFDDCPLGEILKTLSRRENVQFELNDSELAAFRITARFIYKESVPEIMQILSRSAGFEYKKKGTKYLVKRP